MAITILNPNATAAGASLYAITGGSANIQTALSDSSDGTYVQKNNTVLGGADLIMDFGTTTIASTQRVKQVRVRARCSTPNDNGKINVYLGTLISRKNYFYTGLAVRGSYTSPTNFNGPYYTSAPDGSDWTQTNINNLRVKVEEYKDTTDRGKIYEVYVDVDVATQPSVGSVTAPVGSTSTTTPDITWTYVDSTDNSTQDYVEIKVFSSAQYNASGWSVSTSTPTWTSGQIAQADLNSVVGSLLIPATYRCFVRVAKDINGTPFWSDWNYSEFTVSYSTQSVPTMAVAWSASLGKASFTITGSSLSGGFTSQYHQVQRSDDSGVTWNYIRGGDNITLNALAQGIIADYEAPRGITAYYRSRAVAVDSNSIEYPSGWSVTQQVLITNDDTWWFKCILTPSLNKGGVRVLKQLDVKVDEPNTTFRPLGATKPVVIAGPLQGEDGAFNIKTVTDAEWTALYPLLAHQGKLLVQDPYGNQKYIRIIDRKWTAETQSGNIYRDITATYVELAQ
jgi:hypothetical protein